MSGPNHATVDQPKTFAFTAENLEKAKKIIARYPEGRQASAVMPLLDLAQRQHQGWLPTAAMNYVADMIGIPHIRAYEVATFYTMYNLAPVGRHVVQVCTTTPCWLRGSTGILDACQRHLGVKAGETTADGQFTLREVECLGACVNAPVVWIGDDFYEDLTPETTTKLLDDLKQGRAVRAGSQSGRLNSAPEGGLTTLQTKTGG